MTDPRPQQPVLLNEQNECKQVVQTVKNLLAIQETRVQALGWEDPLEKEVTTHASILA